MAIDIQTLSTKELSDLISQANRRKKILAKRKPIATVRRQVEKVARDGGYTLAELFGSSAEAAPRKRATGKKTAATKKSGGKVPPKYRNPANAEETWTGRGKQPRWLAAEVANGRKVEDFLIQS
ncbi:H-NS family nucleoid-associated regulatory protein [Coralloluteibacterium stylophorae]|uniref:H-NS histone family protein n=1 Tax=Coralloluteibacterium stylophorae TaxID=1776034 RepID=A0A8J8AYA1_9GAMM|nr:H-NS histone family protein [Coralloluteibacterium stylophorae]MBS7457801.1 H-NS histone family protein [Coralloluteibacterium stylophorae]